MHLRRLWKQEAHIRMIKIKIVADKENRELDKQLKDQTRLVKKWEKELKMLLMFIKQEWYRL